MTEATCANRKEIAYEEAQRLCEDGKVYARTTANRWIEVQNENTQNN